MPMVAAERGVLSKENTAEAASLMQTSPSTLYNNYAAGVNCSAIRTFERGLHGLFPAVSSTGAESRVAGSPRKAARLSNAHRDARKEHKPSIMAWKKQHENNVKPAFVKLLAKLGRGEALANSEMWAACTGWDKAATLKTAYTCFMKFTSQ